MGDKIFQYKVYTCTSCGAQLVINDVEVSTFCAYCGQPTIVFERLSEGKMPDGIIPFRITKEEAFAKVRQSMKDTTGVPLIVRRFRAEDMKGIYIPHWSFDVSCHSQAYLKKTNIAPSADSPYYYREAECRLKHVLQNGSCQISDEHARKLEPFDMNDLQKFETGYLSGFYADALDTLQESAREQIVPYLRDVIEDELCWSVDNEGPNMVSVKKNKFRCRMNGEPAYVLLPAWFMTFRYKNVSYTIMVNGQTGKVIGTYPITGWKYALFSVGLGIVSSVLAIIGIYFFYDLTGSIPWQLYLMLIGVSFVFISGGIRNYYNRYVNQKRTAEQNMISFVKERQER